MLVGVDILRIEGPGPRNLEGGLTDRSKKGIKARRVNPGQFSIIKISRRAQMAIKKAMHPREPYVAVQRKPGIKLPVSPSHPAS